MPDIAAIAADSFDSDEAFDQSNPPSYADRSKEAAQLARKIGRGCYVALDALGPDTELRLEQADRISGSRSDAVFLEGPFGFIEVMQGSRMLRALTGIDLSNESDADAERWEWLQAAVAGHLADTPFAAVERISRTTPQTLSEPVLLRITLRSEKHAFTTYAHASATVWLELLSQTEWTKDERISTELLNAPHRIPVTIARHVLPAKAFAALAAGDIIVPTSPAFTCDGEGLLRIGGLHAEVRYRAPAVLEVIEVAGQVELDDLEDLQESQGLEALTELEEFDDLEELEYSDEPESLNEIEDSEYITDLEDDQVEQDAVESAFEQTAEDNRGNQHEKHERTVGDG